MKTAIYIEDGVVQLVITLETDFEKNAISTFTNKPLEAKIFEGTFYDCRGGWVRQASFYRERFQCGDAGDKSLILKVDERKNTDEPTE